MSETEANDIPKPIKPFDPATAPGHTDLMVDPETLEAWLEANPLPEDEEQEHGAWR